MSPRADGVESVDGAYAEVLRAGHDTRRLRELLERYSADPPLLTGVLRRAVPVRLLELIGTTPPWSEDARLLAAVVLNPKAPSALALRLVGLLAWRGLADVAASPRLRGAVRIRAEGLLTEQVADLRLGERITLGKIATPRVLTVLLADPDPKVSEACLINPRLREEDLAAAIRQEKAPRGMLEAVAESSRWKDNYALRLALVLQPRTPLGVALGRLSALLPKDLWRVAGTEGLPLLVRVAAERLASGLIVG